MIALATLGLRLARAGGTFRFVSIAAGNAVAVVLVLVALGLPDAGWPDAASRARNAVGITLAVVGLMVPAVVLLTTVGRLSSGVRDRRLASLRLIGVTPWQTRLVATVENVALAAAGIIAGVVAFRLVAPALSRATLGGAGPLPAPLSVAAAGQVRAALALLALSVLLGTAATWNRADAREQRSGAAVSRPRAWRLLVLAAAVGVNLWVLTQDGRNGANEQAVVGYFAAIVLGVVGVALTTPWIASWLATLAARRTRSVSLRLGARATETDAVTSARVVAGLAVAVFLATAALGFLGFVGGVRHTAVALRADGAGPRAITLAMPDGSDLPPELREPDAVRERFDDLDVVRGVLPVRGTNLPVEGEGGWVAPVFVGTCAQLVLAEQIQGFDVAGCDDAAPAWIVDAAGHSRWDQGAATLGLPRLTVGGPITVLMGSFADDPAAGTFTPGSTPITVSGAAAPDGSDLVAFVPATLVDAGLAASGEDGGLAALTRVDVVADGGPAALAAVTERAAELGLVAVDYTADDRTAYQQVRAVVYGLAAIAIGIAVLTVALAAIDRTRDRRRTVASQVMIGVPPAVLRRGQSIQVAFPALIAGGLALALGALSVRVMAHITGGPALVDAQTWAALGGVVAAGAALVVLATLPLTRTRLTPELLRRE